MAQKSKHIKIVSLEFLAPNPHASVGIAYATCHHEGLRRQPWPNIWMTSSYDVMMITSAGQRHPNVNPAYFPFIWSRLQTDSIRLPGFTRYYLHNKFPKKKKSGGIIFLILFYLKSS